MKKGTYGSSHSGLVQKQNLWLFSQTAVETKAGSFALSPTIPIAHNGNGEGYFSHIALKVIGVSCTLSERWGGDCSLLKGSIATSRRDLKKKSLPV